MNNQNPQIKRPDSLRAQSFGNTLPFAKTSLAIGISTIMLMPVTGSAAEETEMKAITVVERVIDHNPYAEADAPYKAKKSADERRIKPLAETPATISVLTQQQLLDTGRSDLRDALRAQPGITLGTGENGNAFGDRYIIRGQEARSDVFVDGLRDPGMSIRESFALEQVEITKGPSATFAGRGATGGSVNAITKQATTAADFTKVSAGIGTDNYRRLTLDSNYVLSENAAVRINLLEAYQGVPERNPADRARKGAAVSFNLKPSEQFSITADYYHLESKDMPDVGTYFQNEKPVSNLPAYAQSEDFLESKIDAFTLRLAYHANENIKISNLTRYGKTQNGYVNTSADNMTGAPFSAASPQLVLATHNGWQDVAYFANQSNLHITKNLWDMQHQFVFGLEYSDQKVLNGSYNATPTTAADLISGGRSYYYFTSNPNRLQRSITQGAIKSDWQTKTLALSAMDTIDFNDRWSAFAGVRLDRIKYSNFFQDRVGTASQWSTAELADDLFNSHLGLTYKFRPDANVYAVYSTASDFNGGESDVTNCGYGGMCLVGTSFAERMANFKKSKPEISENFEIGSKWNLLNNKLLLTAAAFQTRKRDVMENNTATTYSMTGTMNTAQYLIHGIELGLAGNLTDKLSAQGGLAIMNSEIEKSTTANNVGKGLSNIPEKTASLLLNYKASAKFGFGGNVTYQSHKHQGSPETVEGALKVPAYTVLDLFASYKIDKNLSARVNVGNVTNEKYYLATYTSQDGKFTYFGDARSTRVTLNYDF